MVASRVPRVVRVALMTVTMLVAGLVAPPAASAAPYVLRTDIVYGPDGQTLDAYRPASATAAPIALMIHGGWVTSGRHIMRGPSEYMASHGVAVVNMTYRLAPAHPFPAAFHDIQYAVAWTRNNAEAIGGDPDKIVLVGYSGGATLAMLVGLHGTVDVRAIVAAAGAYDLSHIEEMPKTEPAITTFMGDVGWEYGSPIHLASSDDPPVFLLHGTKDHLIGHQQTVRMEQALTAANVRHITKYYIGADHNIYFPTSPLYPVARADVLIYIGMITA